MSLSDLTAELLTSTAAAGLTLSSAQAEQMVSYLQAVLHENEQINVTAIRDVRMGLTQHLLDSLTVALWWQRQKQSAPQSILDLGTGGGFPAAPLAVYWPSTPVLAIDGTGKKIDVVKCCAQLAGIHNLTAMQVRGNDLPKLQPQLSGHFALLTARAVGPAVDLLKELIPLVAPKGFVALLKGPAVTPAEEQAATRFATSKGLRPLPPWQVAVPGLTERQILGYSR